MENKILVTNRNQDTLLIAFTDGKPCYLAQAKTKTGGAISVGRVENAIRNLNAAFVRYDDKEIGYLPFDEIPKGALLNRASGTGDLPKAGDLVTVQVRQTAHGTKQAKLTGYLTLHGHLTVLGFEKTGTGCSKRISAHVRGQLLEAWKDVVSKKQPAEDDVSQAGKDTAAVLPADFSDHFGVILRTEAGAYAERLLAEGKTEAEAFRIVAEEAYREVTESFLQMKALVSEAAVRPAGSVLYRPVASDAVQEQLLRSFHFLQKASPDVPVDIVCASDALYETLRGAAVTEHHDVSVSVNPEADAIYSVKKILNDLTHRVVWLKSGACLVIEETEAMTVVDVNSGKYTAKKDDDFLKVNLEAAEEVMRQIRLRDVSGIVVVDFINMKEGASYTQLKERLTTLAAYDPVFTRFHDITALGLAEITRTAVS